MTSIKHPQNLRLFRVVYNVSIYASSNSYQKAYKKLATLILQEKREINEANCKDIIYGYDIMYIKTWQTAMIRIVVFRRDITIRDASNYICHKIIGNINRYNNR